MRILVVEDDQLLNKTLSYNLSAVGYSVDGAMSKAVAIRFLEKQDYDLIVLDVNLPDGNGFDICREVKERRPDTAVIFLTANDMESDMLKGFELGADDYVTKPFPISVFQKKVSALLNRISAQSGRDFYDDGNLYINFSELSACLAGQPITLTSLEYSEKRTCERIAVEHGVGSATVRRAEKYSRGIDAAEEAVPGAQEEILTGHIKATDEQIVALASIPEEERPAILEELKKKKSDRDDTALERLKPNRPPPKPKPAPQKKKPTATENNTASQAEQPETPV